ncbi:MAG: hypothetical protein IPM97_11240 [Bdellovibrionaceae bacterium]|nr:hypothetical protein [Pseudobdellovibrionaceae bacterium]
MKYLLSFLLLLLLSYPCLKSGIAFAQAQSAAQAPAPTPQPAKAVPAPASSAAQPKNKNPFLRAIDYLFGGPSPSTLNRAPTPENFFGGPGPSSPPPALSPYDAAAVMTQVNRANDTVKAVRERDEKCSECELNKRVQSTGNDRATEIVRKFNAKEANMEGDLIPPIKDENTSGIRSAMCGSRTGGYEVCIFNGEVVPGRFKFSSGNIEKTSREWNFHFENKARQDLGFTILDSKNGVVSTTKESHFMIFPRHNLPNIRIEGKNQIVTLPNGETIIYDVSSKKITGGVFSEDKVYRGEGVLIRADQTGDDGRFAKKGNTMATITKKGKTCSVPKKELWPDQSQSSALHFKYANDVEFDKYLKKRCKFGL